MKNEKGFTLIEMLVVLLIISILILVTIPNVSKHFTSIDKKGCDAYISMVQAQVEAYKIDYLKYPTLEQLKKEGYIKQKAECPNGVAIEIDETTGEVKEAKDKKESESSSENLSPPQGI